MVSAFIGIGTNVEPRESFLQRALSEIGNSENIEILHISSIYETKPLGEAATGNFLNMVIEILTELSPKALFLILKNIEIMTGRQKRAQWGDREIDLDILLYGDFLLSDDDLQIPHPQIVERDFVIVPLLEINYDKTLPGDGRNLSEIELSLKERFILSKRKESLRV